MVFGKLKDEKDFMMDKMKRDNHHYNDGEYCKLNDPNGIIDTQVEISFSDKLTMFVSILEKCITESGDKAKSLNKLHDALLKTKVAYEHYSDKLDEKEDDT